MLRNPSVTKQGAGTAGGSAPWPVTPALDKLRIDHARLELPLLAPVALGKLFT